MGIYSDPAVGRFDLGCEVVDGVLFFFVRFACAFFLFIFVRVPVMAINTNTATVSSYNDGDGSGVSWDDSCVFPRTRTSFNEILGFLTLFSPFGYGYHSFRTVLVVLMG